MRFYPFIKDVPTAGTAVQVDATTSATVQKVKSILFHARAGNTGNIYVGDSSVSATASSLELQPGQSVEISFGDGSVPLSTFYVDAATNGDDVDGVAVLTG
jgi:hypothetical protein